MQHQRRVGSAKPEGVRQRDIDLALALGVRHQIDGGVDFRIVEVDRRRRDIVADRQQQKIASTAPAAPSRCPIDDFVDDIEIFAAASPTSRSTAPSSMVSAIVEVPWALM
jgi:hypothetical protein